MHRKKSNVYRIVASCIFILMFLLSGCVSDATITEDEASVYDDYTVIDSPESLSAMRYTPSGKYVLDCDIDLSIYGNWVPIGDEEHPFTGTFDGAGHLVKGMNIDLSDTTTCSAGLFGVVETGVIRSVGVVEGNIIVSVDNPDMLFSQAGGIAGVIRNDSLVECCFFEGTIDVTGVDQVYARAAGIVATTIYQNNFPSFVLVPVVNPLITIFKKSLKK